MYLTLLVRLLFDVWISDQDSEFLFVLVLYAILCVPEELRLPSSCCYEDEIIITALCHYNLNC